MDNLLHYNSIIYNDNANGEGMRISLFVQGCCCHCPKCFNKETWDFDGGKEFTQKQLNEIMFNLKMYYKAYDGISLLGGNPPDNLDLCNLVIDTFRNEFGYEKTIWIWSGYTWEELNNNKEMMNMIQKCDVLVDGRFEEDKYDRNLKYRGSSNQRIIDIKNSLKENKVILYEGV